MTHIASDFTCVVCVSAGTIFGTTDVYEFGFSYLSIFRYKVKTFVFIHSFPSTANQLMAISMNDLDEDTTDEQELIKRLTQGQARMEQIKRMLVNQRGFIVQALKQLTESNTSNVEVRQKFAQQIKEQKDAIDQLTNEANETCTKCKHQDSADDEASMERDRTIGKGSMVNFGFNDSSSEEWPQNR